MECTLETFVAIQTMEFHIRLQVPSNLSVQACDEKLLHNVCLYTALSDEINLNMHATERSTHLE
jgi:hypothetical protein